MKKTTLITGSLAIMGLLLAEAASAGVMRCGVHLIEDGGRRGPGKYEVLKKCGEPTERLGNTWVYQTQGTKKVLRFNDAGVLQAIDG